MKMRDLKYTLAFLFLPLLILSGGGCAGGEEETAEVPPVSVVTDYPEVGSITSWHRTTGELRSPMESMLSFPYGGRIIELAVDEGDTVVAGQYLGKVDTSTLAAQYQAARSQVDSIESQADAADIGVDLAQTQVEQARAAYEQASADYRRFRTLLADGVATQSEFEQVELRYESARLILQASEDGVIAAGAQAEAAHAGIQAARDQASQVSEMIGDGTLTAPYDGRISARRYDPGTYAGPGAPVFDLIAESETEVNLLEVRFSIPETLVRSLSEGMEISLDVGSCGEDIVTTIERILPEVDRDARTVEIISSIENGSMDCLPGMFGIIRIPIETHENAILLPDEAVLDFEDVSLVYIAQGDTAVRREVRTGLRVEGIVEILEGITETDEVIEVGNRFLSDGARIQRIEGSREETGEPEPGMEGDA